MREGNCLEFQIVTVEGLDDPFRLVAGIDTDRLSCFFAAEDAGVLLKGGDGYLFDDHLLLCSLKLRFEVTRIILVTKSKQQSTKQ